ncbi:MAG TPA: 16S rRNA (cytosine(1402)-N(4))-methyltransferase RsmH [Actinomycetota bacterium]|nr:16S rRNA (cytosine(1402)-N(4))-methyltransferase RsmH [Actinomycetota bacterium]
MPENESHVPVLVTEVVELLEGRSIVVDATVGAGGHAEALLEAGVETVVAVDRDPAARELAATRLRRFGTRFRTVDERFSRLAEAVRGTGLGEVGGVLYDLGVSSMQLDTADRGFSYRADAPLDMRMGGDGPTARDVVNSCSEEELARIIYENGGERFSRRIAAAIVRARRREPIETTSQLAAIVAGAVPRRRSGPHPARRTFQAIRIEVNDELGELAASLPQAASLLEPGGRIAVISYHSLEDRLVKRFLAGSESLEPVTKKPIRPSAAEAARNPRARSAKLRAADRIREEAA